MDIILIYYRCELNILVHTILNTLHIIFQKRFLWQDKYVFFINRQIRMYYNNMPLSV